MGRNPSDASDAPVREPFALRVDRQTLVLAALLFLRLAAVFSFKRLNSTEFRNIAQDIAVFVTTTTLYRRTRNGKRFQFVPEVAAVFVVGLVSLGDLSAGLILLSTTSLVMALVAAVDNCSQPTSQKTTEENEQLLVDGYDEESASG